jgi:hypothetical protein
MHLRHLWCILRQNEDEIHGVRSRERLSLDLFQCVWLIDVLGSTLQDGLETWGILQLFIGIRILMGLEGRDGVVGSQLSTHLGED